MDENTNESEVVEESEDITPDEELTTETDWEAEAKKARGIAQRALTKIKKLSETKVKVEPKVEPVKEEQKTGELDETQLDYLDLKGISEDEDVNFIQKVMKNTGQTLRQTLKDEIVVAKLDANKKAREVKDATPSSTKRGGGGGTTSVDAALAQFDQTGKFPADFELRSKVVDALVARDNPNKPSWHK